MSMMTIIQHTQDGMYLQHAQAHSPCRIGGMSLHRMQNHSDTSCFSNFEVLHNQSVAHPHWKIFLQTES